MKAEGRRGGCFFDRQVLVGLNRLPVTAETLPNLRNPIRVIGSVGCGSFEN
jgi:hypothetical protein